MLLRPVGELPAGYGHVDLRKAEDRRDGRARVEREPAIGLLGAWAAGPAVEQRGVVGSRREHDRVPGSKSCSQVPGQSIVLSSLVTVPLAGAPARVRLSILTWSVTADGRKSAVTVVATSSVSSHAAPLALSQPSQLSKADPSPAVAVRVTSVPGSKSCSQTSGQAIVPSLLVTVPLVWTAGSTLATLTSSLALVVVVDVLKEAVTSMSASRVTWQVLPVAAVQPSQPSNVKPVSAVAVKVTSSPTGNSASHVPGQSSLPSSLDTVPFAVVT